MNYAQEFKYDALTTPQRLNILANNKAEADSYCMGLALYHEARGEPIDGQIVVAATILNRVRSAEYPNSICEVVYQNERKFNRCQFSFACDEFGDTPQKDSLFEELVALGEVVSSGAIYDSIPAEFQSFAGVLQNVTHYHRYDIETGWSPKLTKLGQFGNHVFFKSERVTRRFRPDTQLFLHTDNEKTDIILASN